MALTTPLPPAGSPRPGQDLGGLLNMMTGGADAKAAMNESLLNKMRPALRLLSDLEEMLTKNPEIMPLISTIVQSKFGRGGSRGGARAGQVPMPPVAPGLPGQPVPPTAGQLPPGQAQAPAPPPGPMPLG
jgi:hypothetical protein